MAYSLNLNIFPHTKDTFLVQNKKINKIKKKASQRWANGELRVYIIYIFSLTLKQESINQFSASQVVQNKEKNK